MYGWRSCFWFVFWMRDGASRFQLVAFICQSPCALLLPWYWYSNVTVPLSVFFHLLAIHCVSLWVFCKEFIIFILKATQLCYVKRFEALKRIWQGYKNVNLQKSWGLRYFVLACMCVVRNLNIKNSHPFLKIWSPCYHIKTDMNGFFRVIFFCIDFCVGYLNALIWNHVFLNFYQISVFCCLLLNKMKRQRFCFS